MILKSSLHILLKRKSKYFLKLFIIYIAGILFNYECFFVSRIGSKDRVFELIQSYNLFGSIHDKLETLMVLNPVRATTMLLNNVDKIPVNLVVSKLKKKKHLLYEVSLNIVIFKSLRLLYKGILYLSMW